MKNETSTAEALTRLVEDKHGYGLKGRELEKAMFEAYCLYTGRSCIHLESDLDDISDAVTEYANKNGR